MTLVNQAGDDINASPIAFNDSGYTTAGNVPFTTVVSVLANDAEPLGPEGLLLNAGTTIQNTGTFASAFGGSVTLNADGTFTYISAVGFEGTDTFTYTLRDTGLDAIAGNADDLTDTGTVSITVGPAVWFIDNTAAPGGNGTVRNASRQETACAGNCLRRDAISPGNTMCWTEPSSMKKRRSQRVTTHIFLPRVLHSLESTETTRWIPTGPKVFTHEDEIDASARRSFIWQVCNCARLRAHRVGFLVDGYRVQHYTLGDWITEAFAAMPFRACTEMRHYVASTTSLGPADKLGNDPARRWPV